MDKFSRSPAPATQLIEHLRDIPHWCQYHFPDPGEGCPRATSLSFFEGYHDKPIWLATIDYTKPRNLQVSCREDLGFHPKGKQG